MKYLFSNAGLRLLESLTFTRTLYAFDFDGTLAPIVHDPADARVPAKTARLLAALDRRAHTAVISGRALSDLRSKVSWSPRHMIGNHGLEGLVSGNGLHPRAEAICRLWHRALKRRRAKELRDPGVFFEDKRYSLALHYRRSRSRKEAKRALFTLVDRLHPAPRLILGKSVINLLPVGSPHKGVAILELMLHANLRSALYIGDDDTDEDVFALPESRILTVRVGYKRDSQAHFFLKRQSEVNRVLLVLNRHLSKDRR
jgi:trehalose 6-phosphate phosphatase